MTPTVYLAGFDVFYPDAAARAAVMKQRCTAHGLQGLFPSDIAVDPTGLTPAEFATEIFRRDVLLIDRCDIVAANVNAFRGPEPDSGTCFELGYGYAKGKALYAYTEGPPTMPERVAAHHGPVSTGTDGTRLDPAGMHVEDFGAPVNLMIAVPATLVLGTLDDCLRRIRADLDHRAGTDTGTGINTDTDYPASATGR
ncbi:nucleoside 2-deoxyribosyltransferase [Nakamurella deserti]|uniref:nucleoside 2-deoxyribosyltransferase n=1 Tax=Nakamurella deserti TaxID=2164074 RepID=UPI000DBE53CA|nr:nucleoside 2-deoxyribosyltransferase [Nakamurella deserti]